MHSHSALIYPGAHLLISGLTDMLLCQTELAHALSRSSAGQPRFQQEKSANESVAEEPKSFHQLDLAYCNKTDNSTISINHIEIYGWFFSIIMRSQVERYFIVLEVFRTVFICVWMLILFCFVFLSLALSATADAVLWRAAICTFCWILKWR